MMGKVITVSGQPGSGTTTLSNRLMNELDATYLNAGTVFRELAAEKDMSLSEFSKHVNENPEIDRTIDYQLRNAIDVFRANDEDNVIVPPAENGRDLGLTLDCSSEYFIVESRLGGWIAGADAFLRVWCQAPLSIRCDRVSKSDTRTETQEHLTERQADEAMRYENWYDIDISDLSIYDVVLNTARWNEQRTSDVIEFMIQNHHVEADEGSVETISPFIDKPTNPSNSK